MMPVDRLIADVAEVKKAVEVSESDRRDIWNAINSSRDAASEFKATAGIIIAKLDEFGRRAEDRHGRLDRENVERDRRLAVLETKIAQRDGERTAVGWGADVAKIGAGGGLGWLFNHFFGK